MPRQAGTPKTGGRRKGSRNKRTVEAVAKVEASGLTPLEYLLSVMRDVALSQPERVDAAKAAAPYVHARLTSIEADVSISDHESALDKLK